MTPSGLSAGTLSPVPLATMPGRARDEERRCMTERTLVLIKPDGVNRRLVGEIISRIERKGLTLAALELRPVQQAVARQHYGEHEGKAFFASLLDFITSGPVVAAVVEGPRAIEAFRQLAGGTDPVAKATPAPFGAISVWRPNSTWYTARTRRSPPSGRSHCGSPT